MYHLKIVRKPIEGKKDAAQIPRETFIECRMFDVFYRGDKLVHFWVEYLDGTRATFEVSRERTDEVYIMNANGKTLESYVWGPVEKVSDKGITEKAADTGKV
jgi:hypothetical protein